ncbi:MAG: Lrp/AsnC family transcriptional regulator [Granulosicoccus sp.]|nr:Lrp/AsnC family transcriptional regulator [Granulosicoccus sp.]
MDRFDREILLHLQADASVSNAVIGDRIGLSASQVSRRRARLESQGVITRYRAQVDPAAVGLGLDAFVKVRLHSHSKASSVNFRNLVTSLTAVRLACAISGDADYLLHIRLKDLQALSNFINEQLLSHPDVHEVRSDIVLELIKDDTSVSLE